MLMTISPTLFLLLVTAGLFMGLAVMQLSSLRKINRLQLALTEAATRQEALLGATSGAVLKLGQSMLTLEQRVTLTARRQQELENKDAGSLTYDQASKLIQMGAAPEDLVKTCGLSQAEAKLVSLMAARGVGKPS